VATIKANPLAGSIRKEKRKKNLIIRK